MLEHLRNSKAGKWLGKHGNFWFCLVGVGLCTWAVVSFFTLYYDMNDDAMIRDVLSGAYSGSADARCVYLLYPLALLLKSLYGIWPGIPWFGVFLCSCNVVCVFLLSLRFTAVTPKLWKKILFFTAGVLMVITLGLHELIYIQYTAVAGFLMATAAYWFYTTDIECSPLQFFRSNIVSILLILTALCLRYLMALMLFPFICLIGFFRWMDAAKKKRNNDKAIDGKKRKLIAYFFDADNRIRYMCIVLLVIVGMIVLYGVDRIAYADEEEATFRRFNDARTELYDYMVLPDYQDDVETYDALMLEPIQVEVLDQYDYLLDDDIDVTKMQNLVTALEDEGIHYRYLTFSEAFADYRYRLFHKQDRPYIYFIWAGYFLVVISALLRRKYAYFWRLPILFGLRCAIWMYLTMRGRMPDRITHPLYIMEFAILVAMVLSEIRKFRSTDKLPYRRFWPTTVLAVMAMLCLGGGLYSVTDVLEEQSEREALYEDWRSLVNYCEERPCNLYLLDVYSTMDYTEQMFADEDSTVDNYLLAGGWMCKSPQEAVKLAYYRAENVAEALVTTDLVYWVSYESRDCSWLKTFLNLKGYDVEIQAVDSIPLSNGETFVIWSVSPAV